MGNDVVLGLVVLLAAAAAFWTIGSIALRLAGWLVMPFALFTLGAGAAMDSLDWVSAAASVLLVGFGALLWLAGHWLFAFKHHVYRSALAQRVLSRVGGGLLDPTRNWTLPVAHEDR